MGNRAEAQQSTALERMSQGHDSHLRRTHILLISLYLNMYDPIVLTCKYNPVRTRDLVNKGAASQSFTYYLKLDVISQI